MKEDGIIIGIQFTIGRFRAIDSTIRNNDNDDIANSLPGSGHGEGLP
jgi:hypothetical protein